MFLRDANPAKCGVSSTLLLAKITPFKTSFGFFIIPVGNLYKR